MLPTLRRGLQRSAGFRPSNLHSSNFTNLQARGAFGTRVRTFSHANEATATSTLSEAATPQQQAPADPVATLQAENAALRKELEAAKAKIVEAGETLKDTKDKMLRQLAESENIRMRGNRELDNAKVYAVTSFAKRMLDTADNCKWALQSSAAAAEKGDNADLKTLYDGVVLIDTGLTSSLAAYGVQMFHSLDRKFDANVHDGVFQVEDPKRAVGTVGVVMKEGYMIKDRVLRPATVGTVKAPAAPKPPASPEPTAATS